jgi:saccharopine dehydrogenase-like NADP-dependent oxidoreductase
MKVLLLGVGMQGKAALDDLAKSGGVSEVIAADRDYDGLVEHVKRRGYKNVRRERIDAADPRSIDRLFALRPGVAICLLPTACVAAVARSAVKSGVHLVDTSYLVPEVRDMAREAASKGVTILPEFGMDPGIDLVLLGEALRRLDVVEEILSYGAGVPEPAAADNPLRYKISWTFDGVLISYRRPARILQDGKVVQISDTEQFAARNIHTIEVEGLGALEAYPNGDALKYTEYLDDKSSLRNVARYSARWPGHCEFWKKLVDLHFLDETPPVMVDGAPVSPRRFLSSLLAPQLQYRQGERDVAIIRVVVRGRKAGRPRSFVFQVIDLKDLETGFTAMNRTVGFTASIGAQMILNGTINRRGILSPVRDVPWEPFQRELERRHIRVTMEESAP